jgi:hypothetical protein
MSRVILEFDMDDADGQKSLRKALVEFNLDDYQEGVELREMLNVQRYIDVIREMNQWLRAKMKYGLNAKDDWPDKIETWGDEVITPPVFDEHVAYWFYDKVRDKLWEFIKEEDVTLD